MVVKPSAKYKNLPIHPAFAWEKKSVKILEELKRKDKKVFEITHADPPYYGHLNAAISKYLIEAAEQGWHMYPPLSPWRKELPKAIVEFEKKYRNVEYLPDDIILTPGVGSAWCVLQYTLLEASDDVVAVEPTHYMWTPASYLPIFGTRVLTAPSDESSDWKPDVDELREKITDNTKFIVIVNPNNPTGAVYGEKTLKKIAEVAGEYGIPLIADEIYGLISFDGEKAHSIAEVAGDVPVIVLHGMSKFFMRTGWRLGYIAFHDPSGRISEIKSVAKKFATLYGHPTTAIPTPILVAATKSFRASMNGGWAYVKTLQERRDFTLKRLNEIPSISCVKPRGAQYAFPRIENTKPWKTDTEFMLQLTSEEGVMFIPGSIFGPSGRWHFRTLLMPAIEILEEAFNRLERFLKKHT